MTVNIDPHMIPNLDLLFLFGSPLLQISVHKSFPLRLFCSLGVTRESTFPKIRHIKMFKFKCRLVMHFIVIITVVPLLVNVISNDIYTALLKHSSMLMRFVMITVALIVFGVVNRFFIEVHHSNDRVSLLPCRWPSSEPERNVQLREPLVLAVVSEPPVTECLGPQVTGRPYSPLIYPQVRDMVDCYATSYVNERWGVEEIEFMTGRIHTKDPVPDVEAAMLSKLTLTGSKVLLRRLEIGPQAGNFEIDQLSSEISEAMRRAREIDEDCTLQLGSFAMCKYTDGCLKWWRLQKEWTPTIFCVWRSWNVLDLLKGQSAKWCVRGVNLQSATLKVSTTDASETMNVVHHYKKKSGEDVLLCEEPRLARHAAPKFQKAVYIYALNSVEVEEGVTFDVQSNPKDVPGAYWISVVHRLRNRPLMLIMMACIMIAVLIMNITHGRYDALASKATSISSHDHFQQNGNIINVGILSLFLHELPFFFLTFASLTLISIIISTLRPLIKGQPSGDYVPCFGKVPALQEDASTPCSASPPTTASPTTEDNVLEDVARSPLALEDNVPEEFDNVPGPQTTSPTEDFSSNPNPPSPLHNEDELMLEDVNYEGQEEEEGYIILDKASIPTLSSFNTASFFEADYYESIEKTENLEMHDWVCYGQSFGAKSTLDKLVRLFGEGKNPEVPEKAVRDVLKSSLSANERQVSARFMGSKWQCLRWRWKERRLLEKDVGEGVVVIRLLGKEVLPVVHLQTIKCLADLAEHSQNQEKIASFPGVLNALMSHLQEEDSTLVQEHTARCLANLAQMRENHMKMASSTVLDPLVKLLANGAALPQVHEQAVRCLTNLAVTKDIKERIANYPGLLDALAIQLQKHSSSSAVNRQTTQCLTNLASLQEVQLKIVSDYSFVLDALVRLLGEHRTSDVQLLSLKCLINLSNHYQRNQVAIASYSGVLDAILRLLRYNWITTNRLNVQIEAARCLLKLLLAPNNLLRVASHVGAFDTLVRCLEPRRRIYEVQNSAVKCFNLLAAAPENRLKIVSFPGIVSAMVNRLVQVENSTGQELAAWCLSELANAREAKVVLTSHPGLLKSLVAVLNDRNSAVLEPAMKCLLKFVQSDELEIRVNINSHPDIIDTLVRLLGRHWDVTLLEGQEDIANRLSNLVLACHHHAGVTDSLLLGNNIDVTILEYAATCLSYLAQAPANQSKIASYPGVYDALRRLAADDNDPRAQNSLCLENLNSSIESLSAMPERDGREGWQNEQWTGLQGRRLQSGGYAPYDWFDDPITYDIMCDPVKCSDGVTYDRWTIIDNGIGRSPFNPSLTKFCIAFDDIDVRSRLFHTFPDQEIKFRELRESYREKALQSARAMDFEDAIEKLNHVLKWAPYDEQCRNELDNILYLLDR